MPAFMGRMMLRSSIAIPKVMRSQCLEGTDGKETDLNFEKNKVSNKKGAVDLEGLDGSSCKALMVYSVQP